MLICLCSTADKTLMLICLCSIANKTLIEPDYMSKTAGVS
jgi:hypothetical protein